MRRADGPERMVLEIQRAHIGVRRDGVDPFFAPGAEQLQGGHPVHLGIVKGRDRAWRCQIAGIYHHRVVVADRDLAEPGDVLI